jgi:hypothetical protein
LIIKVLKEAHLRLHLLFIVFEVLQFLPEIIIEKRNLIERNEGALS